MIVGYARVSTDGQTLNAQQSALSEAGCAKVYSEKESGAKTDGAQLAKAIAALGNGDVLIVTKLDRLARSTRDLLNTLDAISKAGAAFKSLNDPWCDTTSAHGKLMVTVLAGLAEFERFLILQRTTEGRTRAQARGVRFGRKPKLTAHQQREALERRARGEALVDIARSYAVSHSTISRLEATIRFASNEIEQPIGDRRVAQTQLSTQNSPIREHILITDHSRPLRATIELRL